MLSVSLGCKALVSSVGLGYKALVPSVGLLGCKALVSSVGVKRLPGVQSVHVKRWPRVQNIVGRAKRSWACKMVGRALKTKKCTRSYRQARYSQGKHF